VIARAVLFALALILAGSAPAAAQVWATGGGDAPRRGSWEAGGGVLWTGGYSLDSQNADLTANDGNGAPPFTLFTTDVRVRPMYGVQARGAFYFSSSLALEGGVQYSRPILEARLSNDAEQAEDITAEEKMSRYVFDGSLVYHLRSLSFAGGRGLPFVLGGAGYLRELHEGHELVETGVEYHAAAGLKLWFSSSRRGLGIRGEAGVSVRDGGFDFDQKRRALPTAGASIIYLF
jgi:hypothetical protein